MHGKTTIEGKITSQIYISTKRVRENLRKVKNELGLKCKMNPHAFRDFINSERFDTIMKAKYRFLLLNQTPQM